MSKTHVCLQVKITFINKVDMAKLLTAIVMYDSHVCRCVKRIGAKRNDQENKKLFETDEKEKKSYL